MKEGIIPITIDLIKELKIRGEYKEAKKLLKIYHENCKKEKRQLSLELLQRNRKIKRNFGICTTPGCENDSQENKARCLECETKTRNWYYEQKEKKKNQPLDSLSATSE